MPEARIRALALCVFRHDGHILVNEASDPLTGQAYFRPLGGGIEFGETSEQTVRREMLEEIGEQVTDLRYLGTLENLFTYAGRPGHEIVQVYDGRFSNPSVYERPVIVGAESDGRPFRAVWLHLRDVPDKGPLYPDGLLALLATAPVPALRHDPTGR